MAKFNYDIVEISRVFPYDETTIDRFENKEAAQRYIKNYNRRSTSILDGLKKKLNWQRVVVIEATDFIKKKPKKWLRDFRDVGTFEIMWESDGTDYRNCPWRGIATELCADDKYRLYRTTNFKYTGMEGFYLVDQNDRLK